MKRLLVLGSDAAYFEYTLIAIGSFLQHNDGWDVLVMDVGLTAAQISALKELAAVEPFPREEFRGSGFYIPTAKARCQALTQFPQDGQLMLYIDSDTVTLGSVEPLIQLFLASGCPIGIAAEDDPRFLTFPIITMWKNRTIPAVFKNRDRWANLPVLNTGVMLATGREAAKTGQLALSLYEPLKQEFLCGEQTIIGSIIYEDELEYFPIPTKYHCFLMEKHLRISGKPYIDPVYLDQDQIVIRHFCFNNKVLLNRLKPDLMNCFCRPGLKI